MLPIIKYKNEIVEAVKNHYVTIVAAETGSGKSTQISQFLAEHYNQVVVTEPRIMAAKTLAIRVSEEMGVTLGQEVGYRTAYDKCSSPDSKIIYCTGGLHFIKAMLCKDDDTENVLIIDEVHEWTLNIEALIAWCKEMKGKWNTKVVIMSATFNTNSLANFFGDDVAVLNVPGNLYEVSLEERCSYEFIDTIKKSIKKGKNILVFVAGKSEIEDVIKELSGTNATVLPLHGELDWAEQKKCFWKYPNSKVIVATNVAQTSITIPDIDVVVDSGEARISIAENGIQGLYLKAISQADVIQRKGRAGRTKGGKYYLCSSTPFVFRDVYTTPEIQRSILDRVVLQMAAIGLDAEKIQFYHQPEIPAILKAKKELTIIGALSDNQVTELGEKIVRIPVSVQLARMIVEAEKYGVTEHVMTIAAIIEMGGLLTKEASYHQFTFERESDLLAEYDVWNYINKMDFIDFKALGINKKNFFKIKDHIKKMKETLYGIVELTHNDDRTAILKSCICGMISQIYVSSFDGYIDAELNRVQLDKHSCLVNSGFAPVIVGIPKTIEYKDRVWGYKNSLNLVTFATKVHVDTLCELLPDSVEEKTSLNYIASFDSVEVTVRKSYAGVTISTETYYDANHPEYARLKAEHEEALKNRNSFSVYNSAPEQRSVLIDGKVFIVQYDWAHRQKYVILDDKTLFTTAVKEMFLDSGERVYFSGYTLWGRREANIVALRNVLEMNRLNVLEKNMTKVYEGIKVTTFDELLVNKLHLGKITLTMDNGGFGTTPILVYGYATFKKNTVVFKFCDDKETAEANTLEVLQYLFIKEVEKRFGESKFSHQTGKKKKILTDFEKETKADFDSFVKEVLFSLTIENAVESLNLLEEYYQDLMK